MKTDEEKKLEEQGFDIDGLDAFAAAKSYARNLGPLSPEEFEALQKKMYAMFRRLGDEPREVRS